jgi:predicted amidohydrolase
LRWACSALVVFALAACGGGGSRAASGPREIAFSEVTATNMAAHDSGATVYVAASASSQATLRRLISAATASADRTLVAAFQGEQRSGGYTVTITKLELDGERLLVHVKLVVPAADAMVTMALTSPAHVVSVLTSEIAAAKVAVMIDESGTAIAQTNIT